MVHKYEETTPETVISQLQMLGHATGQSLCLTDTLPPYGGILVILVDLKLLILTLILKIFGDDYNMNLFLISQFIIHFFHFNLHPNNCPNVHTKNRIMNE